MNIIGFAGLYLVGQFFGRVHAVQSAKLPASELNALHDLYISTAGEAWVWRPSVEGGVWNFSGNPNPCVEQWQGVECTPISLETFRYVVSLELPSYNLYGSLPASIGNLTQLITLDLASNRLHGFIPPEICAGMRVLQKLDLFGNGLHGSIPECIGSMWTLKYLLLSSNIFPGTIPAFLGNLTRLQELGLGAAHLTGTIPACLSELTSLTRLELNENQLSSTVPAFLSQLQDLQLIDLSQNHLTGTFPTAICTNLLLQDILLDRNLFTGTVPFCISNWHNADTLSIYFNDLVGTLPAVFSKLPLLRRLLTANNHLQGTIPANLSNIMNELMLGGNLHSGTVPSALGGLNLTILSLSWNLLTGRIPPSLGTATSIQGLYLGNNVLTGSIPRQLSALRNLEALQLQANRLTGHLHGLFNAANHLKVAFLFGNQFTGTIPSEIGLLPKLSSFAASSNCFTGTIADAVCNSTSLAVLVLDGLLSATSCRLPLLPALHSYRVVGNAHGTVPACLFHMKRLSTLHLSGNGLTGTLPGNSSKISKTLVDVIVSHNQLSGTLPTHFQRHPWITLDVSYNRLTGELDRDYRVASEATVGSNQTSNATTHYAFQNNRLSGKVPASLLPLVNVSTLGSNIFSCATDKHDLPRSDPDFATYECASSSFDYPYCAFIGTLALAAVVLTALLYLPRDRLSGLESATLSLRSALSDWSLDKEADLVHLQHVFANGDLLCQVAVWCTALILLVLVPWYAAASFLYGTYTHKYAWVVSAAFLSGLAPTLVEFFLYSALMIFVAVTAARLMVRQDQQRSRFGSLSSARVGSTASVVTPFDEAQVPYGYRVLAYIAFLSINGLAVVGANLAFVGIVLTQGSGVRFLAQVALSAFKLFWNATCLPSLIRKTARYISPSGTGSGFVTVQVLIALFNNIVVPCAVVAVLSPSCFYSAFDPPAPVGSIVVYDTTVMTAITSVNSPYVAYSLPFTYDYQCSSSLITYYAAAFVYLAIAATLVSPAVKVALVVLYEDSTPGTRWRTLLKGVMPHLLLPQETGTAPKERIYLNARTYIVTLTTYLGILLTFGVMFPPLAVAMCVTMLSVAWQTKVEVGRFLHCARAAGASALLDAIERNCKGANSVARLRNNVYIIVSGSSVFCALFLFDTLGDAVGLKRALWTLIVPPLIPACLYVVSSVNKIVVTKDAVDAATAPEIEGEVEMQDLHKMTDDREQRGQGEGSEVFNAIIIAERA